MLHIILLILKIIGIILLCILGIILLALLAILFIPIRYKIDFSIYEYGSIKCRVSWFLRLISINAIYGKDKTKKMSFDKYVKVFGIRTGLLFGKKEEDDFGFDTAEDKDIFEEINESISKEEFDYTKMLQKKNDDVIELFKEDEEKTEETSTEETSVFTDEDSISREDNGSNENTTEKKTSKIKSLFYKISGWFKKIRFKIKTIYGKIKKAYRKASSIKEFLEMEETKIAFAFLKEQLSVFWKHIKPCKVTGRLKFGTGDPASTGQILGMIYIFYKGVNDKFVIETDFDNQVLEGEIHMKGRITAFSVLMIALKIYRNKNLKNTIHNGKKLKED